MFSNERRQQVERILVRAFIDEALRQGWSIDSVDNGEDDTPDPSPDSAVEHAFECDDARIYFTALTGEKGWVDIVLGNSGWDVISDYTVNLDDVNAEIEHLIDKYEEECYS